MRIMMDRRFSAVMGVLVLTGLMLAFAFVFFINEPSGRTEDFWLFQNTQSPKISSPLSEDGSKTIQIYEEKIQKYQEVSERRKRNLEDIVNSKAWKTALLARKILRR